MHTIKSRFKGRRNDRDVLYTSNDNFKNDNERISYVARNLGKFIRNTFPNADIIVHAFNWYWQVIDFTFEDELYQVNCECGRSNMIIRIQIVDNNGNFVDSKAIECNTQKKAIEFIKQTLAQFIKI